MGLSKSGDELNDEHEQRVPAKDVPVATRVGANAVLDVS
jgi:hypothetical protein